MKELSGSPGFNEAGRFKKLLLVMKLSIVLLFLTCLQMSATMDSQNVSLTVK